MTESRTTDAAAARRSDAGPDVRMGSAAHRPALLGRGIWAVVFGFVTIFWRRDFTDPRFLSLPVRTVALALAVFLVVGAALLAWQAAKGARAVEGGPSSAALSRLRALGAAQVIANVVAAVLVVVLATEPRGLALVAGGWAVVFGALELTAGLGLRGVARGAQDFVVGGGLHLALGVVLLAVPALGALGVFGLVGAVALMSGVLLILGALTARRSPAGRDRRRE